MLRTCLIIGVVSSLALFMFSSCNENECSCEPIEHFSFGNELDESIEITCDRGQLGHHSVTIAPGEIVYNDTIGMTFHYKPWECERSIIIGDSVICLPPIPSESNIYMYNWQNRAEEIIVNNHITEYRYVINAEWVRLALEEMR